MTYRIPAEVYDAVYTAGPHGKDYDAEAAHLAEVIEQRRPAARTLLDVCCGTGLHLARLGDRYAAEGVDMNPDFLRVAAERNPRARFHEGDLFELDLGRAFDVVTCLFASITYARTVERLGLAVRSLARHVAPGGLLIVEPLLAPARVQDGQMYTVTVEEPGRSVTRTTLTRRRGEAEGSFHMHYLVATREGVEYAAEEHRFGIFTDEQLCAALREAGLEPEREAEAVGFQGPLFFGSK